MSSVDPHPLQSFTSTGDNLVVWSFLGLCFLWIVGYLAGIVLQQLRPVIMFVIVAIVIGAVVANVLAKIG